MTQQEKKAVDDFLMSIIKGEKRFWHEQEDGSSKVAIYIEDVLEQWQKLLDKVKDA